MPNTPPKQLNSPLHGITLEVLVTALVEYYDWGELADRFTIIQVTSEKAATLANLRRKPAEPNHNANEEYHTMTMPILPINLP
jgi:uncharacterized protein (DUF2132 family)